MALENLLLESFKVLLLLRSTLSYYSMQRHQAMAPFYGNLGFRFVLLQEQDKRYKENVEIHRIIPEHAPAPGTEGVRSWHYGQLCVVNFSAAALRGS